VTSKRLARACVENLHLLNDLGWDETIDSERVSLKVPPGELVRTLARLHREAAGALGIYVSHPKDEEEVAERGVHCSPSRCVDESGCDVSIPRGVTVNGADGVCDASKPTTGSSLATSRPNTTT
jgi:hypothetical protein